MHKTNTLLNWNLSQHFKNSSTALKIATETAVGALGTPCRYKRNKSVWPKRSNRSAKPVSFRISWTLLWSAVRAAQWTLQWKNRCNSVSILPHMQTRLLFLVIFNGLWAKRSIQRIEVIWGLSPNKRWLLFLYVIMGISAIQEDGVAG